MMAAITDAWGRPVAQRATDDDDMQSASLVTVPSRMEGHATEGLTPARVYSILRGSFTGDIVRQMQFFRDMQERDADLFGCVDKRRRAVLANLNWHIEPPDNAPAAIKDAAKWLDDYYAGMPAFDDFLFEQTDAIGVGFCAHEVKWDEFENRHVQSQLIFRPQEWFRLLQQDGTVAKFPTGTRLDLRLRDNTSQGQELWPFNWIVHTHKALSGYLDRAGLFRVVAITWMAKNFGERDWSELLEIYGIPPRIAKYDPSAPTAKQDKAVLARAVRQIGHDAGGVIAKDMEIELLEAAAGDSDAHERLVRRCIEQYEKVFQGRNQVASGPLGGGSGVNEQNNADVESSLTEADCKQLSNTLTRDLVYPVMALNFGIQSLRDCPRFVIDSRRPRDLKDFGESLSAAQKAGIKIPKSWAYDQLMIPEPQEGDEVLEPNEPAPPPDAGPQDENSPPEPPFSDKAGEKADAALKIALAALAQGRIAPVRDELDQAVDAMLGDWQPAVDPMVEPIMAALRKAVESGESLADFSKKLPALLRDIDVTTLTERIAKGNFLANLAGQTGVLDPKKPPSRGRS